MSTNKPSRTSRTVALQKMVDGLNKHAPLMTNLVIDGASLKTADVVAPLQGLLTSAQAVETTRASWQAAVAADTTEREAQAPFVAGVRQAVRVAFGNQIDALADFGLTPRKAPAPRTPEQKAASAAKGKATRAKRNTMGSKQKQAVKGDVTGVVVTPVTAPAATAPAAATQSPAPAPSGSTTHS